MTSEDDFHRVLDENWDDDHTRLVFADWLQDRGDPRAEGYRALGEIHRRPYDDPPCPWYAGFMQDAGDWLSARHHLPASWFALVDLAGKNELFAPAHSQRKRCTRRELEDAAARAFAKLPDNLKVMFLYRAKYYPPPKTD